MSKAASLSVGTRSRSRNNVAAVGRKGSVGCLAVLGSNEARRFARHPIVLASVLAAAALTAVQHRASVPLWWVADVQLGTALVVVGIGALMAGQLAAGRAVRDGMATLYESYPVTASTRSAAQLAGVVAPVGLSVLLVGLSSAWLAAQGAVGEPRVLVLAGALAVVVLLGCLGVLLGTWAARGWVGLVAAMVVGVVEIDLALPNYDQPLRLATVWTWWLPWSQPGALGYYPGPIPGYPPAAAHLVELVGLALLVGAVTVLVGRPTRRRLLAALLVACIALASVLWSAGEESRPVGLPTLDRAVASATRPAAFEKCVKRHGVTYCAYGPFLPWAARWAVPVDGVLAHLPRRFDRVPVVRQVVDTDFLCLSALPGATGSQACTGGSPTNRRGRQIAGLDRRLTNFQTRLATDPHLIRGSAYPPIYVGLGWATGSAAGPAQLALAFETAYWSVGLPTTQTAVAGQPGFQVLSCVPVGQAREAVAVWLAATSTPAAGLALRAEVAANPILGAVRYGTGGSSVATYGLASSSVDAVPYFEYPETTAEGALLGLQMARLPLAGVESVLSRTWERWTNWRTSDASLAAALRLSLPSAPAVPLLVPPGGSTQVQIAPTTPSPVCK